MRERGRRTTINVQSDWNATKGDAFIKNKPTFIGTGNVVGPAGAVDVHLAVFDGTTGLLIKDGGPIPTSGVSSVNGDSGPAVVLETDDINEATDHNYVTDAELTKLSGIETGAEVNNISDTNATDLTDGGETTLHSHADPPEYVSASGRVDDTDTTYYYFGYYETGDVDDWRIQRVLKSTYAIDWATGTTSAATNWTNRATLTYGSL